MKDHPMAKNVKYIPIGIIEYLLTAIFIKWRVEVKSILTIANSVVVEVPLMGPRPYYNGMGLAGRYRRSPNTNSLRRSSY